MLTIKNASLHTRRIPELSLLPEEGRALLTYEDKGLSLDLRMERADGLSLLSFSCQVSNKLENWLWWDDLAEGPFLQIGLDPGEPAPYLADYQHMVWWTRPFFETDFSKVPERTQFLIVRRDEAYQVLLPLTGARVRADLAGTGEGLSLKLSALGGGAWQAADTVLLEGEGDDPYDLMHRMMVLAKKLKGDAFLLREEKAYPEILRSLGWCSWDSLHQEVSEAALFARMEDFRKKGIAVPWVLIDDGWSLVDKEAMTLSGLDADPVKFPGGLAHTIRVLKEKYHVRYVGVWQAFQGYWNGLTPGSAAHRLLSDHVMVYPGGMLTVKPTQEDSFGFWSTWHSYLRRQGVDFVKVDNQSSFIQILHGCGLAGDPFRALHTGLEASVFLHFGGNLINCMGMSPESTLARTATIVTRASDDYRPLLEGSLEEHILQNVYNSIWQGELYVCDWDMFWSEHTEAKDSAILRTLSGGPVYCSDGEGRGDKALLDMLTDDGGRLLTCDRPGRPALDCLVTSPLEKGGILKVCSGFKDQVYVGCFTAKKGEGILEGTLSAKDLPEKAHRDRRFLVYDRDLDALGTCRPDAPYRFSMEAGTVRLLALVPEDGPIVPIGMTDKYIAGAGIESIRKIGDRCLIVPACRGTLAFAATVPVKSVTVNGLDTPYEEKDGLCRVEIPEQGVLVEIIAEEA